MQSSLQSTASLCNKCMLSVAIDSFRISPFLLIHLEIGEVLGCLGSILNRGLDYIPHQRKRQHLLNAAWLLTSIKSQSLHGIYSPILIC